MDDLDAARFRWCLANPAVARHFFKLLHDGDKGDERSLRVLIDKLIEADRVLKGKAP